MKEMKQILEILEKDARVTPEEIGKMLDMDPGKVKKAVERMEKDGIILKYKTIINREAVRDESSGVRALIEVSIAPQKNLGFERIAERIYLFPEVVSCYLMSGTYDLLVIAQGRDLHEVASFVSEKLAPMENIMSTATHFILKKYKEDGDVLKVVEKSKRPAISL